MPAAQRELYIEIPQEDQVPGEGDMVARMNRSMYGFRDASNAWMKDWTELLAGEGYATGVSNPALFYNKTLDSRGCVHGDDFYVVADRSALDRLAETLGSRYEMRENARLGFSEHCTDHAVVLNRVVTLGTENISPIRSRLLT